MSNKDSCSEDLENLGIISNNLATQSIKNKQDRYHPLLRIISIVTSIFLLSSILSSEIISLIRGNYMDYKIMTFDFSSPDCVYQTHVISLMLILIILSILLIIVIYSLVSHKDENFRYIFYNDSSVLLPVMKILFSISFLFGILNERGFYAIIVNLILTLISSLCSILIYRSVKSRKNLSILSLISHSSFISVILSIQSYFVLYNIFNLVMVSDDLHHNNEFKANLAITANVLYACCTIVCLTTAKDIFYPIVMIIIDIGYLVSPGLSSTEIIVALSIIFFTFTSIIIIVVKYKKGTLGYQYDNELVLSLQTVRNNEDGFNN